MKLIKRSPAVKWITLSWLLVFVCSGLSRQPRNEQTLTHVTAIIQSQAESSSALDSRFQSKVGDGILIGDAAAHKQLAMVNGNPTSWMR